jgi:organic hydroperoxide reductase OsmC/OhrA
VDRPDRKAGGKSLGFNGAELLGLAIGGCFCNDLRYVAASLSAELGKIEVSVTVVLGGNPLLATGATLCVHCEMADRSDASTIIARGKEVCTVANLLRAGVPVQFLELRGGQVPEPA